MVKQNDAVNAPLPRPSFIDRQVPGGGVRDVLRVHYAQQQVHVVVAQNSLNAGQDRHVKRLGTNLFRVAVQHNSHCLAAGLGEGAGT